MKLRIKGINIIIDYYFIAVLTLVTIVTGKESIIYCFLFCLLHESGHLIAMIVLREKVRGVRLGYFGMKIECHNSLIPAKHDIIISFAGPAINLILAIIFYLYGKSELANMNFALAMFNLIPIQMLDGGRILSHFVSLDVTRNVGIICGILLTVFGIATAVLTKSNIIILIVSLYVLIGAIRQ